MPINDVYDITAEDVFNLARGFLNDQLVRLWKDDVLMIFLQQAHRELQVKLRRSAAPVMKGYSDLIVQPLQFMLTNQPMDMVAPISLWERPQGAPFDAIKPMTEYDPLPPIPPTTSLQYWMWIDQIIQFVGATITTEILLIYWRQVPIPSEPFDTLGIIDAEQYLAPRVAALAAASVGEEATSSVAAALAESQLLVVISANRGRAPQDLGVSVRP